MGRSFRATFTLSAALAALLYAAPAIAQTGRSLAGENLAAIGDPFAGGFEQAQCNADGTTTLHFDASGAAAGPYPGTFTESGTVTIRPQVNPGIAAFGFNAGPVLDFNATFRIDATDGSVVTGTKQFDVLLGDLLDNHGTCTDFQGVDIPFPSPGVTNASGRYVEFKNFSRYHATIHDAVAGETFDEQGIATSHGERYNACPLVPAPDLTCIGAARFDESFITAERTPPPAPQPAAVVLSPKSAVNTVGTTHTVTATVVTAVGLPVPGTTVLFTVTGSVTTTGSCTTGADGQCSFTYSGPKLPGADAIRGCVDAGGPCDEATKAWILPAGTPGKVTGGGYIPSVDLIDTIAFGFNAKSQSDGFHGNCNVIDHALDVQVKCLDVSSLVQAGTHATFFGNATVNGAATTYRIDVEDLGEPGRGRDTFEIQTASGYSAAGVLSGGNIQTH